MCWLHSIFMHPLFSLILILKHSSWSILHPQIEHFQFFSQSCSLSHSPYFIWDLASHISGTLYFCREMCSLCIHARASCIYDYFSFLNFWENRAWWMSAHCQVWYQVDQSDTRGVNHGACQECIVTGICNGLYPFSPFKYSEMGKKCRYND